MRVTVKYFGQVAEAMGTSQEVLHLTSATTAHELKLKCLGPLGIMDQESIQVAVNQNLDEYIILKDGDEVALLPPFAGG